MLPSYFSVPGDSSISKQELILQQCIQGSELSWEDTSLAFFSLDFVFVLVEAYFQPLKLLATLPPTSLFHLLESATRDRYPTAIEILERSLVPYTTDCMAPTKLVIPPCQTLLIVVSLINRLLTFNFCSFLHWKLQGHSCPC